MVHLMETNLLKRPKTMDDTQPQFDDHDSLCQGMMPFPEHHLSLGDTTSDAFLVADNDMGMQNASSGILPPPIEPFPTNPLDGIFVPMLNPPPFPMLQSPPDDAAVSLPDWIHPVGYKEDGTPVLNMMPFNTDEIEGAFVVQQYRPFPPHVEYVEIPEKGIERAAKITEFYETIKMDSSAQDIVRNFEMDCLDRIHQSNLDEMERMKYDDKIRDIQNEMHDREIAHIRHQTMDQYHAETKHDLTQVSPPNTVCYEGIPSQPGDPNLFRDDKGDLYRLNPDGTPYRVNE